MRLLIVEDDPAIAEPLREGLTRNGYDVDRVTTGRDAVAAASDYDLVLLDLGLPDIDGKEVCREIRRSSDVPIIVVTARGDEIDRVILLEFGADDYLVKPFGFRELAARITAVTRRSKVQTSLPASLSVKLDDRASFKASQQEQFDAMLAAVNGLLGLALFIALLGIGNTLALSVLERTREIGLLRAVGMVRGQTRLMVLDESAMVAVFGAALGVVVGLFFGAAVTMALPASVAQSVAIPYTTIAVIVLIAAVCGLVAGLIPARRASRLDVLAAVAAQ